MFLRGPKKTEKEESVINSQKCKEIVENLLSIEREIDQVKDEKENLKSLVDIYNEKVKEYNNLLEEEGVRVGVFGKGELSLEKLEKGFAVISSRI